MGLKNNFGLESSFWEQIPFLGEEGRRKMGEERGLEEDQVLVGFLPIFLLLGD